MMCFLVRVAAGQAIMGLQLAATLAALNFTLDHGRLLRAQQVLTIRTIHFMWERTWPGGRAISSTLEAWGDGLAAGSEESYLEPGTVPMVQRKNGSRERWQMAMP